MSQHDIFLLPKTGFKVVLLFFSFFSFMIMETKAEVTVCVGDTLYLETANRGDSATYFWNGPNGFTSTEQNPIIPNATIDHGGNYIVEVTIRDTVVATDTVIVTVGSITARFDVPGDQFVIGQPIPFTDLSESAVSWNWDFGNGRTSSVQNPQYTYPFYGIHTVSLTVTDSNNCTDSYQTTIHVIHEDVVIPNGVITTCDQLIMDPGGNAHYPNNTGEIFTIISENGTDVLVEFLTFGLGAGDQLCIYNGATTSSPLIGCYTGSTIPQTILSDGDAMTFHFISDSVDTGPGWIAHISCLNNCDPAPTGAGSPCNPEFLDPFCTDDIGVQYHSGTPGNATTYLGNGRVACFTNVARPSKWFYLKIDDPGNLLIYISQVSTSGTGMDVDFICWGPFSAHDSEDFIERLCCKQYTLYTGWTSSHRPPSGNHSTDLGGYPIDNLVDCSYSGESTEWCYIPNAQTGEYYLLLITNYRGGDGIISFNSVSTTYTDATTDCSIVALINNNGPLCEGADLEIRCESSKPGLTYHWSGPDNFSSTERYPSIENATIENAGTYIVTLILDGDTLDVDSMTVEIHPYPELTTSHSSLAICNGDTVILRASGANQYEWSNSLGSDTLAIITPTSSGTYRVTGTSNGCSVTENISITVPSQLTASITSIVTPPCSDAGALRIVGHVNGGSPPYSYQWSGLGILDIDSTITQFSTDMILCDSSIIVRILAHDTNGCEISAQSSMTFRENQPPVISGNLTTAPADDTGTEYTVPDLTTALQNTTTDNCTSSAQITITQNPPQGSAITANTMVTITATDRCGNSATVTTEVIVPPPLIASITNRTDVLCHGDHTGSLTVTVSGGVQPYRYQWSTTPPQTNETASNLQAGIYSVTVFDAHNRQISASDTVSQSEALALDLSAVHTTCGNPNGEAHSSISGGTAPYHYLWSNSGTEESIFDCVAGNYNLTVTDANGCHISDNVTINNSTLPIITLLAEGNTNCQKANGFIEIDVSDGAPPYQFNWSNGHVTQNLYDISAGTYLVTVTDEDLCAAEFSHTIIDFSPTVSIVSISPEYCGRQDGWISIEVSGNQNEYITDWQSIPNFKEDSAFNLYAGNYTVMVLDGDCEIAVDFTIPHINAPDANFSLSFGSENIIPGISIHFIDQSTDASQWIWNFGDGNSSYLQNPYHEYAESGDYITMLTVTDDNKCIDTTSMKIVVQDGSAIYVPNAFAPGSNRENAIFKPVLHNIMYENYIFSIYDRYGRLIFNTINTSEGWDGTIDGEMVPAGTVFVYIIQYQSNDMKKHIKKGTVVTL